MTYCTCKEVMRMPVPGVIAAAAESFRFNNGALVSTVKELSDDEWLRRPSATSNHMAWIVGHVIWSRKIIVNRLGQEWSRPWLDKFARGVKLEDAVPFPSPQEMLEAWQDVSGVLEKTLESTEQAVLDQPTPKPGPPSADGKYSGFVNFMALHETYHVGQMAYVCTWLGHKGPMG
jgi:uncharacterized damage-inducible protein DinB